jgi:hypothetical protein
MLMARVCGSGCAQPGPREAHDAGYSSHSATRPNLPPTAGSARMAATALPPLRCAPRPSRSAPGRARPRVGRRTRGGRPDWGRTSAARSIVHSVARARSVSAPVACASRRRSQRAPPRTAHGAGPGPRRIRAWPDGQVEVRRPGEAASHRSITTSAAPASALPSERDGVNAGG